MLNAVFVLRAPVCSSVFGTGMPPQENFFLWWTFEILDLPDISTRVAPRRVRPAPRLDANCAGQGRLFEVEEYGSWGCRVKNTGLLGPTKALVGDESSLSLA